MRPLVIGYVDSPQGEDALVLGATLSRMIGLRPHVVTVLPWPEYLYTQVALDVAAAEQTRASFEHVREELAGLRPVTETEIDRSPARGLQTTARGLDAELIVIGSAHRGSVGCSLLGSAGESLLMGAPCPVAVAPHGYAEGPQSPVADIAVAFDDSPESRRALDAAIELGESTGARLTLLAVVDLAQYQYATTWATVAAGDLMQMERDSKRMILDEGLSRVPSRLDPEGRLLTGNPGAELLAASKEFDLMFTGSRGYGPLRRTLAGSSTRGLLRGAACPVVITPRPERSEASPRDAEVVAVHAGGRTDGDDAERVARAS